MSASRLAALALLLPAAAAAQYDPRFEWRTVETARFRVHYHQGLEELAQRAARTAERAHAELAPLLGHEPEGKVEVVLSDDQDDANGSAEVIPRNVIRLFAVAPGSLSELNDYGDWLDSLVLHEYTHILHLDTVGGFPRFLDRVFGKVFAPASLGPGWLTEGIAVLHESGPGAGRNESALFDMWARAMLLEGGGLPGLDLLSSPPLDWPRGSLWYLLGGRFLAFLRERNGEEALRAFTAEQGSQIWPYLLNTLAGHHFGASFGVLWAEFGEHLRVRYREQVEAARARGPFSSPRILTRRGGEIAHLRFEPGGAALVYAERGLHERPQIRRVGLDGADLGRAGLVEGNGSLALLPAGRALVADSDVLEEYRVVDDLYIVDLARGSRSRLTYGERATDPDVAPDGAHAVYVARLPGGEHELRRIRLDGSAPEPLLRRPGAQLFLPRIAPDGRRIALEIQEGGRRDVAIWDGEFLRKVTDDAALDQQPAWSPDGKTLFFASDRSGIPNVHAFDLETGRLRQVTHLASGALQPAVSPDGKSLAFLAYSPAGYDLALLPLDPATWLDPAEPAPRPAHRLEPEPPAAPLPSRPYRALDTVGPAWWLPLLGGDSAGYTLGAITGGTDVVLRHSWALDAAWGLESRQLSYDAAYAGGWSWPQVALASSRAVGSTPETPSRLEVQWVPVDAGLVFTRTHLDRAHALTLGWRWLLFRPQGPAPPLDPSAAAYRGGTASEASLGLVYGSARRFGYSISREEGGLLALRLRYASPDLGGDQSYTSARASGTGYLRVPWTRHVVLALHSSVGAATGTIAGRQPFSLGGVPPPDLAGIAQEALGGGFPSQADLLRGYPSGAFSGTSLVSTTAELRFPLLAPQTGYSTWPLFLRRIHGALFLDAGAAFRGGDGPQGRHLGDLERLRFGAGAEARLEVVLGYYLRTDLRLGVARGLGALLASPRPADPLAGWQFYVTLGESF